MTTVLLLRHGQCISNTLPGNDRIIADEDNRLTVTGKREVVEVVESLKQKYSSVKIFASPTRRALETVQILSEKFDEPAILDVRLREREFNFHPLLTIDESIQLQHLSHANPRVSYSNGETIEQHRKRVQEWFDEFVTSIEEDSTYIIVTHGGTIDQIQAILFDTSIDAMSKFYIACEPAHFHHWTLLSIDDRKVWRLEGVNVFK